MVKNLLFMTMLIILLPSTLSACVNNNKDINMKWVKSLKVNDIKSIEAVTMASLEDKRYKKYEPDDFDRIVKLINSAKGVINKKPEAIYGTAFTYYITTTDETRHTFTNVGNVYLIIDGVTYNADKKWITGWATDTLDSKTPSDFIY